MVGAFLLSRRGTNVSPEPVSGHPFPPSLFSPTSEQKIYLPYAPSHPGAGPNGEDVERRTKEQIMWDFSEWIGGYYEHPLYNQEGDPTGHLPPNVEDFDWTRDYTKTTVGNMLGGNKAQIVEEGLLDWKAASRTEVPEV